jgi:hypothetical protein
MIIWSTCVGEIPGWNHGKLRLSLFLVFVILARSREHCQDRLTELNKKMKNEEET